MEIQNYNFWEAALTVLSVCFTFLIGHNFWLTAKVEPENTRLELITSDIFPHSDSAIKPERIKDFRVFRETESVQITDYQTQHDLLTANIETKRDAKLAAVELYPHPITLNAEKFASYIASEDAEAQVAPHFVNRETSAPQRESYAKFSKMLFDNGSFGAVAGHQLEIILLNDPAGLKPPEKLQLRVLFENQPIENLRVSSGAENVNGGKYAAHARCDAEGYAEIEIASRGWCFVRTHFIRRHSDAENFEWESFWASLTFKI